MKKQRLLNILSQTAGPCRAVAFDVFDTLLFRDTARPSDVFRLMERTGEAAPGFAQRRLDAEAAARRPHAEVTLAEIYAQPALQGADPAAECAAELRAVHADAGLLAAARACKARGLAVYVVSDMYLPETQVTAMLRRCGFDFLDGVFVSSEYGVQKRSGRLFRLFLQKTGLKPRQVLFVGNDRRPTPSARRWRASAACWSRRPPPRLIMRRRKTRNRARCGRLCRTAQNAGDPAARVGFGLLGPLLAGFAAGCGSKKNAIPARGLCSLRAIWTLCAACTRRRPRAKKPATCAFRGAASARRFCSARWAKRRSTFWPTRCPASG